MVNEILTYAFYKSHGIVSIILYIFTVGELAFFLSYFFIISANRIVKRYIQIVFPVSAFYVVFDYFFLLGKKELFTPGSVGVEAILIITLCIYYFYEQLKEPTTTLLYTQQSFWIIIAFLIFQSGTFFVYLYSENNSDDKPFKVLYSTINSSFSILKNVLFSIAMLKKPAVNLPSDFPHENLMSDWE